MINVILMGLGFLLPLAFANGGQIRIVEMDSNKMKSIRVKMGQSTVLRFLDKPKKVVIGNQNYYSVEFIESDVTIQPLGAVRTNLFVYTKSHVYGFILEPKRGEVYDDIVKVKWRSSGVILSEKNKAPPFREKVISIRQEFSGVSILIDRVIINKDRGTHIIDFLVENRGKKALNSEDFNFFLSRSGKKLELQEFALEKSKLRPKSKVRGRLLVRLKNRKGFSFNSEFSGKSSRKIISRKFL